MSLPLALKVKLFGDAGGLDEIEEMARNPLVAGFTTNPTLMRKAGITDYRAFAISALQAVGTRPISFEVLADDFDEMEAQAHTIASWGERVYVKIPVTTTGGVFSGALVERLSRAGVRVNVTAVMTTDQVERITTCLATETPAIISVFAGRIADTGRDPVPILAESRRIMQAKPKSELLWASPREVLNVFQADAAGCHIVTTPRDILKKLSLAGKDLAAFSLETVQMFYNDAKAAGYRVTDAARRP